MFKLIKHVDVYAPDYIGKKDILICGETIVDIDTRIDYPNATVIDATGLIVIPGLIDQHIHLIGGGGEAGFETRTLPVTLHQLVSCGITTVVGLLGTDALSRFVEDLLAKTKALNREGITAYCLTGAYTYPSPTITGSVAKDIAFISEIMGVKLAISDRRESFITKDELKRLASEVTVASMLASKPGIITLHLGDDPKALGMVNEVLSESQISIKRFRPTHVTRNDSLFREALNFAKKGGYIDLTVGHNDEKLFDQINKIIKQGLGEQVTFSSDGNGSWSKYDADGRVIAYGAQSCDGILKTLKALVHGGYDLAQVLPFATINVAKALGLEHHKGKIAKGYCADLVMLDDKMNIKMVMARGRILYQKGEDDEQREVASRH